jgi:hypothetical protein
MRASNILRVMTMSKDNIDVWLLEPGKGALETFDDVLLG